MAPVWFVEERVVRKDHLNAAFRMARRAGVDVNVCGDMALNAAEGHRALVATRPDGMDLEPSPRVCDQAS